MTLDTQNSIKASKNADAQKAGQYQYEAELMEQISQGSSYAFEIVVQDHSQKLLSLAQRMLGDRFEAEEVVQFSLMQLWRNSNKWEPGRAKINTWLYRVVVNRSRDILRQRKHNVYTIDTSEIEIADTRIRADELLEIEDRGKLVREAINKLPERQKLAIIMAHYDAMPHAKIADALSCSIEAIESLLSRARKSLKKHLSDTSLI